MYTFMKRMVLFFLLIFYLSVIFQNGAKGQCSICAKTTQQMGEKPAKGFNSGIIYLMLAPLGIMSYLGYRWWKNGNH